MINRERLSIAAELVVDRSFKNLNDDEHLCTMLCALNGVPRPSQIFAAGQWEEFRALVAELTEAKKARVLEQHGVTR